MLLDDFTDVLPDHLAERTRPLRPEGDRELDGEFVIYWMRNAARGHENPALDVAVDAANRLDRPPFVYQPLSEAYPYASDRHHTFALEGAAEVAEELADRGIGHALHVQREGHRERHLADLCDRAALVVVEDVPVDPLRTWRAVLTEKTDTPMVAVDADCIVPMRMVGQLHDRAYKFRNAVEDLREERIDREWRDVAPQSSRFVPDDLPVDPVDLDERSIPELVARCDIDHAVAPVPGKPGGARAGYERWETFREEHLDVYNYRRNTPSEPDAVSRLSAHLHWGHVSPFRIAREANAHDSKGADKYIDEMVTWRELAHHFCYYDPNYDTVDALPDWALETLREHESDERPALYDWETLARAETDDDLWNLCQEWLLRHGELHNNIRMTWAKKLLEWTPNVETALQLAIDLNHRYALDGRDPNSYHGIQWCFGAFDRPHGEADILGTVRSRDTDWQSGRLDMEAIESHVRRPFAPDPPDVAVVGAGVAGTAAARTLADHGVDVDMLEKSRGTGGRTPTRWSENPYRQFDHGAPAFTADDERFDRYVRAWTDQERVAAWQPKRGRFVDGDIRQAEGDTPKVATPKMSELAGHLAEPVPVHTGRRVESVDRTDRGWRLEFEDDAHDEFDALVLTPPAPQTVELVESVDTPLAGRAETAEFHPLWTAMIGLDAKADVGCDWLELPEHDRLAHVYRDSSKPGRPDAECWVVHADPAWAEDHLELDYDEAADRLVADFTDVVGVDRSAIVHTAGHRWRYGRVAEPVGETHLFDGKNDLAMAGDWVAGGGVEGAFLSGQAAAGRLLGDVAARN